jgi:hypothetical protein
MHTQFLFAAALDWKVHGPTVSHKGDKLSEVRNEQTPPQTPTRPSPMGKAAGALQSPSQQTPSTTPGRKTPGSMFLHRLRPLNLMAKRRTQEPDAGSVQLSAVQAAAVAHAMLGSAVPLLDTAAKVEKTLATGSSLLKECHRICELGRLMQDGGESALRTAFDETQSVSIDNSYRGVAEKDAQLALKQTRDALKLKCETMSFQDVAAAISPSAYGALGPAKKYSLIDAALTQLVPFARELNASVLKLRGGQVSQAIDNLKDLLRSTAVKLAVLLKPLGDAVTIPMCPAPLSEAPSFEELTAYFKITWDQVEQLRADQTGGSQVAAPWVVRPYTQGTSETKLLLDHWAAGSQPPPWNAVVATVKAKLQALDPACRAVMRVIVAQSHGDNAWCAQYVTQRPCSPHAT